MSSPGLTSANGTSFTALVLTRLLMLNIKKLNIDGCILAAVIPESEWGLHKDLCDKQEVCYVFTLERMDLILLDVITHMAAAELWTLALRLVPCVVAPEVAQISAQH